MAEEKDTSPAQSHPSGNWVDRYGLRYGPGTVVGAVIVLALYLQIAERLPSKLPAEKPDWATMASVAAVLGFGLCYISSAPIALLHAARSVFFRKGCGKAVRWGALVIGTTGLAVFFLAWRVLKLSPFTAFPCAAYSAWGVGLLCVAATVRSQHVAVFAWYDRLAKARKKRPDDLVESYRTLREHGNAFMVVAHELAFGIVAYALVQDKSFTPNFAELYAVGTLMCALWIIPGLAVWAVGTHIEVDFVDKS